MPQTSPVEVSIHLGFVIGLGAVFCKLNNHIQFIKAAPFTLIYFDFDISGCKSS